MKYHYEDTRKIINQLGLRLRLEKSSPTCAIRDNADSEFAVLTSDYKVIGYYYEYDFNSVAFFDHTLEAIIDCIVNERDYTINNGLLKLKNNNKFKYNYCINKEVFNCLKNKFNSLDEKPILKPLANIY